MGLAAVAINRRAYGSVVTSLLWGIVYPFDGERRSVR